MKWENAFYYPINELRNIAWNYARSPWVDVHLAR